ncbi:hypothetical protein Gogos_000198, partial [Gossypium gossypioides]|nr:hypothetical protein [Gossypium gossypioides]
MVQFQFLMVFASIRGGFRDHCAKWISGFTMQTGDESVFKIEKLRLIHQLLGRDWKVRFRHILRDHNKVANSDF